jgi:enoyl-CoA hydratase
MGVLLYDIEDGIATVTLNRPEARNALSSELIRALADVMSATENDDSVGAVVLTGADPAFCAGLDLKELGSTGANFEGVGKRSAPWSRITKPVIGAVNGVAVTGGLELALNCDFVVASERAKFGDTHARVGIMPAWGLSVLLPRRIGLARAIEMSLTGNFMAADEALAFGLVNHVVGHDELVPFVRSLAADIVGNDAATARNLLASYRRIAAQPGGGDEGLKMEYEAARTWRNRFDPAEVERRRALIMQRGRTQ